MVTLNITTRRKSRQTSENPKGIEEVIIDVDTAEDLDEVKRLKDLDTIESIEVEGASISMADSEVEYDEFLDEIYGDFVARNLIQEGRFPGDINAEGPRYSASDVFKELDPTFYRIGFTEYQDRIIEDTREELEQYEDEKSQGIVDYIVSWIDY